MVVPVGSRHEVTLRRTVEVPFRCPRCRHEAVALVQSEGLGERSAPLFIGQGRALDKATRDAEADLLETARTLAEGATCPGCRTFDAAARRRARVLGLVAPVGLVLGGAAVDFFLLRTGWPLTAGLALAYASWLAWSTRWRWTEFDRRVSFRP